ncbi:MAG: YifB family Mg chelatase-like AAA ATPase [Campylobacterota bacterium]
MNVLQSAVLDNLIIAKISIEATFTRGLPAVSIVGLASSEVQESRDRVKSALLTNGFKFPPLKVTINLSPSGIKKNGTHLDLAIALLMATKDELIHSQSYIFGELGLGGEVKHSNDIFPIVLGLKEKGLIQSAIVPKESMPYLSMINGIKFYAVENLKEAIDVLKAPANPYIKKQSSEGAYTINNTPYYIERIYLDDFKDVKGQEIAKRAALIAAAGMHNLLLEGSPGCGKSMIAKRISYIMAPMSEEEILTVAKNQFLNNKEPDFKALRPFIAPHNSATKASLFGGGSQSAKIGEVAMAHKGVLFFDELPHFQKSSLESLREPLQDRAIHISRVNSKIKYDTDFLFVGAMNPCPCGNLFSKHKECRCSDVEIKRYKNKLSQPILDRIELYVVMQEISKEDRATLSSKQMQQMVLRAFTMQKKRDQEDFNGKLGEAAIEKYCAVKDEDIIFSAIERFGLTHRSINNIKKVARTIADLEGSQEIEKKHLLEALSFRKR